MIVIFANLALSGSHAKSEIPTNHRFGRPGSQVYTCQVHRRLQRAVKT